MGNSKKSFKHENTEILKSFTNKKAVKIDDDHSGEKLTKAKKHKKSKS